MFRNWLHFWDLVALTPLLCLVALPLGPEGDVCPKPAALDTDETQPMEGQQPFPTESGSFSLEMPMDDIPPTQPEKEEMSDQDDDDEDVSAEPEVGVGVW